MFAEPFACEPSSLGLGKVAGRAPEPPHVARGRSGVPLAFCTTLVHPFRSEGGVCLPSPLGCEPGSLGLGKVAGRAPKPPHGVRGRSGVPLAFYATLAHPFRSKGGVCLSSPLKCEPRSLGLGKVCRESPQASAQSERAVRVCLSSPLECEPGSLGLGKVAGRAP